MSALAAAIGDVDFGNQKAINVADPVADQDAATKKYHDDNRYTDAEAVSAVAAADEYVKNIGDTINGVLTIINSDYDVSPLVVGGRHYQFMMYEYSAGSDYKFEIRNATGVSGRFIPMFSSKAHPVVQEPYHTAFVLSSDLLTTAGDAGKTICDFCGRYNYGVVPDNHLLFTFSNYYILESPKLGIWSDDRIDFFNNRIKDPKNYVDATLSGTPKIIEILIGATPYYFKVYPTKT